MTSKAIFVREIGGPEQLSFEALRLADPAPGHARLRVEAAGVNFIDCYFRSGQYPRPLPFVAALEACPTTVGRRRRHHAVDEICRDSQLALIVGNCVKRRSENDTAQIEQDGLKIRVGVVHGRQQ